MASRSPQSCISNGYRLYVSSFRSIFKASWPAALLFAVCFSGLVTVWLMQKGLVGLIVTFAVLGLMCEIAFYSAGIRLFDSRASLKRVLIGMLSTLVSFLVIICVTGGIGYALALAINAIGGDKLVKIWWTIIPLTVIGGLLSVPLLFQMFRYILSDDKNYFKGLWKGFKTGMGHWTLLFSAFFISLIVIGIMTAIILLPANVLAIANYQSAYGQLYGDPAGMPGYVFPMTIIVMLIAGFAEAFIRMTGIYIMWFSYGSAVATEKERKEFAKRNDGEEKP